jgi:hypothetical protein
MPIRTYTDLRKQIREALLRQHPEWIDANGNSPLCDSYEAGLAKLLALFKLRGTVGSEMAWDLFQTFLRPELTDENDSDEILTQGK